MCVYHPLVVMFKYCSVHVCEQDKINIQPSKIFHEITGQLALQLSQHLNGLKCLIFFIVFEKPYIIYSIYCSTTNYNFNQTKTFT